MPKTTEEKSFTLEINPQIRDWWYSVQDRGFNLPESDRVKIESIFKQALKQHENELEKRGCEALQEGVDCCKREVIEMLNNGVRLTSVKKYIDEQPYKFLSEIVTKTTRDTFQLIIEQLNK